jgi:hypothetical protein
MAAIRSNRPVVANGYRAITSSAYDHGYGQHRLQDILLKILAAMSAK